jgi:hypothetical protein
VRYEIDQTIDAGDRDSGQFLRPLIIDQDGNIIEGEARLARAKANCYTAVPCLVYDLNKEQSLRLLLELAIAHDRLNRYCRVVLADMLSVAYTKRAQMNDIAAEPSALDNDAKRVGADVVKQLAQLAGVSTGTYRNARFVRDHGIPRLKEYVKAGKMSVHRAYGIAHEDEPTQTRLIEEFLDPDRTRKKIVARLIDSSRPEEVSFEVLLKGFRSHIEKLGENQSIRELCDKATQILNAIERTLKSKGEAEKTRTEARSQCVQNEAAEKSDNCARAPDLELSLSGNDLSLVSEIEP